MNTFEVNFDGLMGLTHNYGGLSYGNIASMNHKAALANPREAALQGLVKAKALADMGLKQGIIVPQERPAIGSLRRLGFSGSDAEVLQSAYKAAPELLAACSSASSVWTANAATVSPSADSADGKLHFTAANLNQKFHRAIESKTTTRILQAIFRDEKYFTHHEALPHSDSFGDEGAANHTRFCAEYGKPGLQFFVYGRSALDDSPGKVQPARFPARQTREASQAVARLHKLSDSRVVFAQQNPQAIDGGAFHNDVVAVGNQQVLFYHEKAFLNSASVIAELKTRFEKHCAKELLTIEVPEAKVPLQDAVKSYLFNSQLVTLPNGRMSLITPSECREVNSVHQFLQEFMARAHSPIAEMRSFDVRQSMQNGGGPACLRLRVVLSEDELAAMNSRVLLSEQTYSLLRTWITKHYRDRLSVNDLADPQLLIECRTALDELTQMLGLGSIYPFQTADRDE